MPGAENAVMPAFPQVIERQKPVLVPDFCHAPTAWSGVSVRDCSEPDKVVFACGLRQAAEN
jgi:hypothetical protein